MVHSMNFKKERNKIHLKNYYLFLFLYLIKYKSDYT